MGGKPRFRGSSLAELAEAVEEQQQIVTETEEHLSTLKEQLAQALGGGGSQMMPQARRRGRPRASPGAAAAPSRRGKKFFGGQEYWESKRQELLDSMGEGELYTGSELEALVAPEGGPETFVRQVRQPLLQSRRIKKVSEEGNPWRKGMFPASARWTRA